MKPTRHVLFATTAAVLAAFALSGFGLMGARSAHANEGAVAQSSDDDDSAKRAAMDGLEKINRMLQCKNRCHRVALSCMAGCPNGNNGASCRGQCQLDSSNCSMDCDN